MVQGFVQTRHRDVGAVDLDPGAAGLEAARACRKFIAGLPMKPAESRSLGARRPRSAADLGFAWSMMQMRSAMDSSIWSWVT